MRNDVLIIVVVILIVSIAFYTIDRAPVALQPFKRILYVLIALLACIYLAQKFLGL